MPGRRGALIGAAVSGNVNALKFYLKNRLPEKYFDKPKEAVKMKKTMPYSFGEKHIEYIRAYQDNVYNIAMSCGLPPTSCTWQLLPQLLRQS